MSEHTHGCGQTEVQILMYKGTYFVDTTDVEDSGLWFQWV